MGTIVFTTDRIPVSRVFPRVRFGNQATNPVAPESRQNRLGTPERYQVFFNLVFSRYTPAPPNNWYDNPQPDPMLRAYRILHHRNRNIPVPPLDVRNKQAARYAAQVMAALEKHENNRDLLQQSTDLPSPMLDEVLQNAWEHYSNLYSQWNQPALREQAQYFFQRLAASMLLHHRREKIS